jgi:RHS repeat-associated protein
MSTYQLLTKREKRKTHWRIPKRTIGKRIKYWDNIKDNRISNDIRTTEYKYDMFGNIIETILLDGTTIKVGYNDKGQKISETNQLGQTRYFEYDDNGQLIKVTLPEVNGQSPVYEYTYDAQGNQLTIKDPNGNVTKFTYDDNGNQLTQTLPDGSTEYFEYDFKGRLVKQTSFEGVVTTYKYDSYNRLESKTFTQNGTQEVWTYTYDAFGRVSEIDQNGRVTKTTYDSQGRTIRIEMPEGSISYTYDKYGNPATVQTDNDPPTYYTYDRYGRLATVSHDNKTTYYEYDVFGNLSKTKLPNEVTTIYQYDNMNRLIKLSNFVDKNNNDTFDNGEGISEFSYTLDNLGRKDYAFEKFWTEYGEQENEIDWEYDDIGRLIYEKFDHYDDDFDQTSEWLYDLVGNRLKQTINDTVTTYNYDVNDRLLNEATNNKTTIYGYAHTQQTSKKVSENGVVISETTFEYDAQGRMSVVIITTASGTEKTTYGYDSNSIRVSAIHEANGIITKTEYLNDSQSLTGYSQVLRQTEFDVEGNIIKTISYVIGHQRISQIVVENGTEQEYYFTFDGHGSTRALLDFIGAIIQLYSFDAYGNALGFDPSQVLTEFLYSGEQFDSKIGQQYLRAKYYNSATGRFNRLDPFFGNLSDTLSLHKYLYTHADPVNGIDPSGLFTVSGLVGSMSSMVKVAAMTINVIHKVHTFTNSVQTIITSIQTLYNIGNFLVSLYGASAAGSNLYTAFGTALKDTLKVNPSDLLQFQQGFNMAFSFIAREWNSFYNKILNNAHKIATDLATDPTILRTIISHKGREVGLIINLPSPPYVGNTFLPNIPWKGIPRVKIPVKGMNIYWRSDSSLGRLFAFEWTTNKKDNYNLVRIDYQDFHNKTFMLDPHYHISDNPAHFPLQ